MGFYEDMEKSLLESIEMEKGNIPMTQRENMPAPTFVASDKERELIDEIVNPRKTAEYISKTISRVHREQTTINITNRKERA